MRAGLIVLVFAACQPKVSTTPRAIEHDLDSREAAAPGSAAPSDDQRAVAPPGKGLRTGTIARASLVAVLDAGPGTFLRQVEVAPRLSGNQFVGWQLVQLLDRTGPLHDVDLVPGDVLLAINGKPLSRPDQLQSVWDSLRTANAVTAQMWRGAAKLELRFAVEPAIP
jgi:S1-C subfamily serine protease